MESLILNAHAPDHQQLAIAILNWCRQHPRPVPSPPLRPSSTPARRAGLGPSPAPSALPAPARPPQPATSAAEPEYMVDADIRIRQVGPAGGKEQHFFHYYVNKLLIVNLNGHPPLFWRTITTDPGLSGREGALLGTESFPRGTVGYGVHASIGLIRTTLGDFGQARIGTFFTRPDVQRLLALPDTADNNRRVAQMEYEYWQSVRHNSSWGEWAGGTLGSQFNPTFRTYFPMYVTAPGRHVYDYTRDEIIDPVTGYVSRKLSEFDEFARRRLHQLRERFGGQ